MGALPMTRLPDIANRSRKPYPSDLSDTEWEVLEQVLPQPKSFGHPVEVDFEKSSTAFSSCSAQVANGK